MRVVIAALLIAAVLPPMEARAQDPQTTPAPAARSCGYQMLDPSGVTHREEGLLTLQDPFKVVCSDGAELRANSGVVNEVTRVVNLNGNVFFQDLTRTLTSEQAVYEINIGRLYATGNVVFTDQAEGTTLRGPELEYFRAMEGRPEPLVNAMGRPHLTLRRQPAAGAPPEAPPADTAQAPLEIDGDRMTIIGQNNLTAYGNVVIEDPNMRAIADEAEHRGAAETLELRGNAEIHSREYSLLGQVIFATVPGGSLREVEARGQARLLGQDLNVDAPQLNLLFENDLLQQSIARSDPENAPNQRPVATSPTFRLVADSIEANLPGQRLRTVVAIGSARGESIDTTTADAPPMAADALPDTAAAAAEVAAPDAPTTVAIAPRDTAGAATEMPVAEPPLTAAVAPNTTRVTPVAGVPEPGDSGSTATATELVENDWIVGDTITGYFASVEAPAADSATAEPGEIAAVTGEPGDTSGTAARDTTLVMERLVALGEARSLYHVAPQEDSPPGTPPGINFLSAAVIELRFANGQVAVADVTELSRGIYLDPLAVTTAPADSVEAEDAPGEEPPVEGEPAAADEAVDDEGPGGAEAAEEPILPRPSDGPARMQNPGASQ